VQYSRVRQGGICRDEHESVICFLYEPHEGMAGDATLGRGGFLSLERKRERENKRMGM
jgi:hypothetical protein